MTTYKDTDLREALRRKYADTPQLPADFMQRMHHATEKQMSKKWINKASAVLAVAASVALVMLLVWPKTVRKQNVIEKQIAAINPIVIEDLLPDSAASTIEEPTTTATVKHQAKTATVRAVGSVSISPADSLDYYISKIERELAEVDDSLYIERIQRVIKADERLQRIVNNYIMHELHKEGAPHQANNINPVNSNEDEE
jgi:hypothetical protein